jgi:colicin import membrane protein
MKKLDEGRSQFRRNLERNDMRKHPSSLSGTVQSDTSGLLKPGAFSLLIHVSLVVFLLLNLKSATMKGGSVYRVTLVSLGDGKPPGNTGLPGPGREIPTPLPDDKLKPMENRKGTEMPENRKNLQEKTEKRKPQPQRIEEAAITGLKSPTKKEEKPDIDKGPNKSLQEALEDIHKKVALDAIRKKVAQRDVKEKSLGEGGSTARPFQGPVISFSGNVLKSGPGSGPGTGAGTGTGTGTGVGEKPGSGGSPWGSSLGGGALDSMLSEYSSRIWAKIEKKWTLPGDVPKGKVDLETIIVIVIERDGKIQKSWFEKRSWNGLYDQMAMRAIKKAEPLPPIPKEFSDDTFEIGLRFHPD